ncbi:MBL fold metallo-hydrolase [Streptomyces sp. NPDC057433]|uniref:MBL fold metallo-hydrolase n=1 Tax=Streptomyces sp. NPDC057433 TaxID=3346132 RepID=UPI00367EC200
MRAGVRQVADGTHLVHGSDTDRVVLQEGNAVTPTDTGYPGDRGRLLASPADAGGSPESVAAVLIARARTDHLGSAEYLRAAHGTPVHPHEAEVPHARRDFPRQVTVGQVLRSSRRPGGPPWALHVVRSGGTAHVPAAASEPFPRPGPLDLPGRPPCTPLPHRRARCVLPLPDIGAVVPGDALVSSHPTSRIDGPHLLPRMFHHERAAAVESLDILAELEGDLTLPGNGSAHRGSLEDAAEPARERAQ